MTPARILIVEDEGLVGEALKLQLTEFGYVVTAVVTNGAEVILAAEQRPTDLALMDIRLQGKVDGIGAAQILRERFDVPVIYLTAFADDLTLERARQTAPLGYLVKPIRRIELKVTLEMALHKRGLELRARQAEAALRESEERFRHILETAADAVIVANQDQRILLVNQEAERIFGYPRQELLGQLMEIVVAEGNRAELRAKGAATLARADSPPNGAGLSLSGWRKDGVAFPVEIRLSSLLTARGPLLTAVIRDLTERNRLEEQLHHAQRIEAVGQLAGGMAHDFNNLLTVINGYSEIIAYHLAPTDPHYPMLQRVMNAGMQAASLTQQMLAFSGKQVLQPVVLNLHILLAKFEIALRPLLGANIELVLDLAPEVYPVKVDPGQLNQALMNLAINARDTMPHGGQLILKTQNVELDAAFAAERPNLHAGSYVLLTISDTGGGMDEQTKAHVFEPFFTTKKIERGAWLGLAPVLGIIRQSGGHIEVDSKPGCGTTFRIYLPGQQTAEPAQADLEDSREAPRGTGTVLLVEDDEGVRRVTRFILQRSGYTVLEASDAEKALPLAKKHPGPIDILVTDVIMPGMTGRQLSTLLAPLFPTMKVLYMSGYTAEILGQQGILEPSMVFVQKPYSPAQLTRKVHELLGL